MGQTKTATYAEVSFDDQYNNNNFSTIGTASDCLSDGHKLKDDSACDFGVIKRVIVDADTEDTDNNNGQYTDKNGAATSKGHRVGHSNPPDTAIKSGTIDAGASEYAYFFGLIKVQAQLKWLNIVGIIVIHCMFIYTFMHSPLTPSPWTYVWGFIIGGLGGFGVTGGAHRLWSHRSYKAKTPLRIILMLCFCIAGQNPLYDWVRDHRVHHKFSETSADPHDSNRGFFFAHVGWLMMNKHPEVLRKGKLLDMSDILADPVVRFHEKYFIPLKLLMCFILPVVIPMYLWNETFFWGFYSQCVLRYVLNLNFTWLVNSAAHMWGNRPFDARIRPVQNLSVSIVAMGEGWHNYHHVFPWDYKASELGNYYNVTTFWIELFAKIGWAYDLKQPSQELIRKTAMRHGDDTHAVYNHHHHHHMDEVPDPDAPKDKQL